MARDGALPRDQVAQAAHLSASRFNHLFRQEMGVSFRSYRVWSQVRAAMAGLATQARLTDAALHGAFSDSAHFSRTFRQTFGMTPSSVLKPLREVTLEAVAALGDDILQGKLTGRTVVRLGEG